MAKLGALLGSKFELICLVIVMGVFFFGAFLSYADFDYFENVFIQEDHALEWAEVVCFGVIGIISFKRAWFFNTVKNYPASVTCIMFGLIFFFGVGEELSWGQRLFDFPLPIYFYQNNIYHQFNVHGLNIMGIETSSIIFGDLLATVLKLHLIVVPLLYFYSSRARKFFDSFAIPIPKVHHSILFTIAFWGSMTIVNPASAEEGELLEFAGAFVYFFIFTSPVNADIFLSDSEESVRLAESPKGSRSPSLEM